MGFIIRVNVTRLLKGKEISTMLGIVENERSGSIDGNSSGLGVGINFLASVELKGIEMRRHYEASCYVRKGFNKREMSKRRKKKKGKRKKERKFISIEGNQRIFILGYRISNDAITLCYFIQNLHIVGRCDPEHIGCTCLQLTS